MNRRGLLRGLAAVALLGPLARVVRGESDFEARAREVATLSRAQEYQRLAQEHLDELGRALINEYEKALSAQIDEDLAKALRLSGGEAPAP